MHRLVIFIFFIVSTFVGADEFRTWSNPDKTKSFEGQFINRKENRVTLQLKNLNNLVVDINDLHEDDKLWLNQNHPAQAKVAADANTKTINGNTVFDTLVFGDDRETVLKKLNESKIVATTVASAHIGRTGLNNIFHTREKIGGLACSLSFDWGSNGELIEITLQSENKKLDEYTTILKPCWKDLEALLISIYGNPKQAAQMPKAEKLQDSQMLASHLWSLEQGGSILLGSSKMDEKYQVVVRFTKTVYP